MEGCADPFNRQYYPWGREDRDLVEFYRSLARLKNLQPALKTGTICGMTASNGQVQFCRKTAQDTLQITCNQSREAMRVSGKLLFGGGLEWAGAETMVLQPGGFCVCRVEK